MKIDESIRYKMLNYFNDAISEMYDAIDIAQQIANINIDIVNTEENTYEGLFYIRKNYTIHYTGFIKLYDDCNHLPFVLFGFVKGIYGHPNSECLTNIALLPDTTVNIKRIDADFMSKLKHFDVKNKTLLFNVFVDIINDCIWNYSKDLC